MRSLGGLALRYDFARVLVQRFGLWNQVDGFIELRVILQRDFEALVQSENAGENFALNLPFQPGQVLLNFRFAILDVLIAEVGAELVDNLVGHHELLAYIGLGAEVKPGEIADALGSSVEHAAAIERCLEIVLFGSGDKVVRRDATLSKNLAAAIGELHFRLLGLLRVVVIIVERDVFVITLNQAAAGRVITGSGEQQSRVFAERELGLHQTLAEARFADDQAAVMILYGPRNDFGSGSALPIDEDDDGDFKSLVSAHGVVAALRGRTSAVRNHDFVFVQEHIGQTYGLTE